MLYVVHTYMPCMLKIRRRADHTSVYPPTRALRLRRGLVTASEPLQPDFTTGTGHLHQVLTDTESRLRTETARFMKQRDATGPSEGCP